ncbi:MAG: lipoate--protein ligase family protein [Longimicrobiales bacterium]
MLGPEPAAVASGPWRRRTEVDGVEAAIAAWSGRGLPGEDNMAIDRALFADVQNGGAPVLRLYTWDPACISFGRNQRTDGIYDLEAAAARGIDVVRRPTGGLAVLHDRELTYSVCTRAGTLGSPRETYRAVHLALVEALRSLGVDATLAARPASATRDVVARRSPVLDAAVPCFKTPAGGEITARGGKLVGSAQRCEHRAILQHGSILVGGSQHPLQELLLSDASGALPAHPGDGAADGWTSIEALGETVSVVSLAAAIVRAWASRFGGSARLSWRSSEKVFDRQLARDQ